MYKTEWTLEGGSNCRLNFALHYNSKCWIGILPMVFWPPYSWYIDPPTNGISTSLAMVFWPPYPWYIDPYSWYNDPLTHGILTILPMEYRPPFHGILTSLSMVYRPPYPWYFDPTYPNSDPPTHDILTSLPISWLEIGGGGAKYPGGSIYHTGGVQFSIREFNIQWMKIDPGVNLPWGSKYHMTPGITPIKLTTTI